MEAAKHAVTEPAEHGHVIGIGKRAVALAALGALGVVYGDIGTSPLYAVKECLAWSPDHKPPFAPHAVIPDQANVLGILSLMFWVLVLVICVKYIAFVLRADNKGEGGILALSALAQGDRSVLRKTGRLTVPVLLGLFGAGLLFGESVITPAISVLGAMEGLGEQSRALSELTVPITVGILVGLFLVQRHGTGKIGVTYGPVMLLWFFTIGVFGLRWIIAEPSVLQAINPVWGLRLLSNQGPHGFVLMGLVFLVCTGGEALYADMGHFGRIPIRYAWFAVALPGLLLNYFGQGAVLLAHQPGTIPNPFYATVPDMLLIPMLVLATAAAIIASQALISGIFSITRQAMQLGYFPRVTVVHTSANVEAQIYIPEMNWLLMVGCIAVTLQFRSSSGLAAAYGLSVTGTMCITSYLFYLVCKQRWGFSEAKAAAFLIPFLAIDVTFFAANAIKIPDGGWFPLAGGICVFAIMTTWWRGRYELSQTMESGITPMDLFFPDIAETKPTRVKGTAVFMSSSPDGIPNVLIHHLKHNQVLHEQVVLFSVKTENVPWIAADKMVSVDKLEHGFYRVVARVGFMQSPDVPQLLAAAAPLGLTVERMTTTYYLGRQTLLTSGRSKLAYWRKILFSFMSRNSRPPTAFFNLPPNRVVELGLQIEM